MRRRTVIPLIGSALIAVLTLAGCAPSKPAAAADSSTAAQGSGPTAGSGPAAGSSSPVAGGSADTLTIATTSDVVNYNPLVGNSRTDYWITNLMYPHLLSIDAAGNKEPSLATKWGYTDPKTGFYDIRSDFTWSDGTPLTADDVAYTLNAVKKDKPAGTLYGQLTNFVKATAVSPTRVEVALSEPDSTVIAEIGFWGNIVPEHIFSKAGSVATFANDKDWVGAGPYTLTSVAKGQSYTMKRVDSYPLVDGGTPRPAAIVYRVYPDVNTEILALRNGDVDMIANALPPTQVKTLQGTEGIKVEEVPGLGYAHMTYNMKQKDLAKLPVRQALAATVDYDAIRNVVLQGQAVSTGSSPIMPVLKDWYDPSLKEYAYDPDQARKLLTDAGYTSDSNGQFPLKFRLIYSLQDAVTSQWVNLVKDGAAKAGITIDLQGLERNTYLAKTNEGDFDIYAGNFAIMDDPATNMALTYLPGGAINYSYVDDPKLNELISKSRTTTDRAEQKTLLRQAAKLVHDNVYDNIMYTQNLYVAFSDKWSGFIVKPSELLSIVDPVSLAAATTTG
ncbi:ABC transporter substrate-binding protein [Nakamurella lactea]|uniref:ABC transporter substrate-binding protein n=1 Tax=Nakamurella lactea TaxID=459515 RepID=UPI0009FD8EAB|nr:ABC transporter substrate-binding protein [Nakamurella lactea]